MKTDREEKGWEEEEETNSLLHRVFKMMKEDDLGDTEKL